MKSKEKGLLAEISFCGAAGLFFKEGEDVIEKAERKKPMGKTGFLKDWGRVNLYYLFPASLLVPLWGFFQPASDASAGLSEIWLFLLFYSNLFALVLIGLRYLGYKKRDKIQTQREMPEKDFFLVPLSFGAGTFFYLLPFAFLAALALVETQSERFLSLPQVPRFLETAPFLLLCFFFAFPLLWAAVLLLSWSMCSLCRFVGYFYRKWQAEQLKNRTQKSMVPLSVSWLAVNIFYLLPAALALPLLLFQFSEDEDAFFVLVMGWILWLAAGNLLGMMMSALRWVYLKKRAVPAFKPIVLSPKSANLLYIFPLIFVSGAEMRFASAGKGVFTQGIAAFFADLPAYLGFFLLDLIGLWLLASALSWMVRATATLFWQPDPRPALGKKKQSTREMPDFLIALPAHWTGNLLDLEAAETAQPVPEIRENFCNRPKTGIVPLYHFLFPEKIKQAFLSVASGFLFYLLPLALAWGGGAVWFLGEGGMRDMAELGFWACLTGFLLSVPMEIYLFVAGCLLPGVYFCLTGKLDAGRRCPRLLSGVKNFWRYLVPAPCLVAWLATVPGFFSDQPISSRAAFIGAVFAVIGAFCLVWVVRGVFSFIKISCSYFFGNRFEHLSRQWTATSEAKKQRGKTYDKWRRVPISGKEGQNRKNPAPEPASKRCIICIETEDGRRLWLRRPPKRHPVTPKEL